MEIRKLNLQLFNEAGSLVNTTIGYRDAYTGSLTPFTVGTNDLTPTMKTYYKTGMLKNAKPRKIWLVGDRRAPLEWTKANESLANYLSQGRLQAVIEGKLAELETRTDHPVLVVTDLEALHPYLRIGAVESALYGKFKVPTVFMYPGVRAGATKLKFLGFYPEDGNYRSVHVGG